MTQVSVKFEIADSRGEGAGPTVNFDAGELLFRKMRAAVYVIVAIYIPVFWVFGAKASSICLLGGLVAFVPFDRILKRMKKRDGARLIFLASCNYYILSASIGLRHLVNSEYYCLPAMMLALLLFDLARKRAIILGFAASLLTWGLITTQVTLGFPSAWTAETPYAVLFERINFLGAFATMGAFLTIFIRTLLKARNLEIAALNSAAADVRESEAKFRTVVESMREGLFVQNEAHEIVTYNQAAVDILGVPPTSIKDGLGMRGSWRAVCEDGTPFASENFPSIVALKTGLPVTDTVMGVGNGDGAQRWLRINAMPFKSQSKTGKGAEMQVAVTFADISELRARRRFLEVVMDNIPSMVFVKDYKNRGEFSLMNKAGEALLGVHAEDLLGKSDHDLFPVEQAEFFVEKDREVFRIGKVLKVDCEQIETAHGKRFLSTLKVPTFGPGGRPDLLIGISNDITEELRIRIALEAERAKLIQSSKLATLGEMSAGIAHEINNPLAIVTASLHSITRYFDQPEKMNERLATMAGATERIAKIVRGLRKFSRSSEKSEHRSFCLENIVQDALVLTAAKAKGHDVTITFSAGTLAPIICDELEIAQVLINLINNGIDAVMRLEERWLNIDLVEEESAIRLRITDSGTGIPAPVREKLFQPFFTTKPVGEGTGLGLSISKGILDDHKATIQVAEGVKNTCFEISFPKVKGKSDAA